jgi:hypothetical protein
MVFAHSASPDALNPRAVASPSFGNSVVIALRFDTVKGTEMKTDNFARKLALLTLLAIYILLGNTTCLIAQPAPAEKSIDGPNGQTISVKMIGPITQTTDLQIICILKHDPSGDKYVEAIDEFNKKLHNLLSGIRDRGEFTAELGETLLFTPPSNTITPRQVLLIGIGDEADITLDKLQLIGEIAAREAARLGASHVSFAPTLRDQGSTRVEVGDGDAAFATGWILAYDTERKLASQGLSSSATVSSLTIEAGPKYFASAIFKVSDAVQGATTALKARSAAPYSRN